MQVLHHCDMPPCVNPDHFFLGSQDDNIADMVAKDRQRGSKGIKHPLAKLNPAIAFSIRWHDGIGIKPVDNAKIHGIYRQLVYHIVKNKIWQQECHD
jgi:hypothetical protein